MKQTVQVYPDLETMSRKAASLIIELAEPAVRMKGFFTLVLSGGSTPQRLYRLLGEEYMDQMPWERVHLFWGDERNVPKDSSESNFRLAWDAMISKVPIPNQNIHSVPTKPESPAAAATSYEACIRDFFHVKGEDARPPAFDLVLLGLGADGHTASLFPGDPVLSEKKRWVSAVHAPSAYKTGERITLTLPILNCAEEVMFIVSGVEKKGMIKNIINDPAQARKKIPAAMIIPRKKSPGFWTQPQHRI